MLYGYNERKKVIAICLVLTEIENGKKSAFGQ